MTNLIPSFPNAVKRSFFIETEGWDANIKVDYDTKRNPIKTRNLSNTAKYMSKHKISVTNCEVSKTRKGYHLRVWLSKPIGPYTTLKLQSMLGDDPMRQIFNARRVRNKRDGWNVLFNEKWRGKTLAWKESLDIEESKNIGKFFWFNAMKEEKDVGNTKKVETILRGVKNGM